VRHSIYALAFGWMKRALAHGFYLEAVTIAESVISDRLISQLCRLGALDPGVSMESKARAFSGCAWEGRLLRWPAMSAGPAGSRNSKCSVTRATGGAGWLLRRSRSQSGMLLPTICCHSIGREMATRRVSRWPNESGSLSTGGWPRFSSACRTAQCSGPRLAMLAPAADRER
jgi:hypothetical protein